MHYPDQQYRRQQQLDKYNQAMNHPSSTPVRDNVDYENLVDLIQFLSTCVDRKVSQQQQQLLQHHPNLQQSHLQLKVNPGGIDSNAVGNVEHSHMASILRIITPVVVQYIHVANSQVP